MQVVFSQPVEFESKHFLDAIELWINNPEFINRQNIKRAEIVESSENENLKRIVRQLIPNQDRNAIVKESIEIYQVNDHVFVKFTPSNESNNLPNYYPTVNAYSFSFDTKAISVSVDSAYELNTALWQKLSLKLLKLCKGNKNGYVKRVNHDRIIPKILFQNKYAELKAKYKDWVEKWPKDGLDPSKHDIAIATFLILLWNSKPIRFVDLGCGNGFLVYILTCEGFHGYGIDISKRKQWDLFGPETRLYENAINPKTDVFSDADFIIGNHPDELTLWIPILAHRSNCEFIIIPCCFHQLDGSKFIENNPKIGKYRTYVNRVLQFVEICGFVAEEEVLRIPSTKNICIVGRTRSNKSVDKIDQDIHQLAHDVQVAIRVADKDKKQKRHRH